MSSIWQIALIFYLLESCSEFNTTGYCLEKPASPRSGLIYLTSRPCKYNYICNCSCPEFNLTSCEVNCKDKNGREEEFTQHGCPVCKCACPELDCPKKCQKNDFQQIKNSNGCFECKCICPELDCNATCEEGGFAGFGEKYDDAGCPTCGECSYPRATTETITVTTNETPTVTVTENTDEGKKFKIQNFRHIPLNTCFSNNLHSGARSTFDWTETPWTETPLDRDPPGHVTCSACWDRDPPPLYEQNHRHV